MNDATRTLAGIAIIFAAILLARQEQSGPEPPTPTPQPVGLSLEFSGDTATQDAAILSALFEELADEIQFDGQLEKPLFTAAVHFDSLRTRARVARVRGQSIGDRQPRARDQIGDYLTAQLGTSGGPVDAAQRSKWVEAFRVVARACHAAR